MQKLALLFSLLACTQVGNAAGPPKASDVPSDIHIFRLPWMALIAKVECAERYPELEADAKASVAASQVEIRKAESLARNYIDAKGTNGERYLAVHDELISRLVRDLEQMDLSKESTSLEQCRTLMNLVAPADRLFRIWVAVTDRTLENDEKSKSSDKKAE